MKKQRHVDFREFVFTAGGKEADPDRFSVVDLYDNLIVETDRLYALADLLAASEDEIEGRVRRGLALLFADVAKRLRAILEVALRSGPARDPPHTGRKR